MFLGCYRFLGDPELLIPAYDALMESIPPSNLLWHACVRLENGLAVYDACPDREIFRAFAADPGFMTACDSVGLPAPEVVELGEILRTAGPGGPVAPVA